MKKTIVSGTKPKLSSMVLAKLGNISYRNVWNNNPISKIQQAKTKRYCQVALGTDIIYNIYTRESISRQETVTSEMRSREPLPN